MEIRIIPYEEAYCDDMIFMILEAKNALGRIPTLNPDLLDVEGSYLRVGGGFRLALDENGRVVGSIGWNRLSEEEARLHRLYVKASLKRRGIGSLLLKTAEDALRRDGFRTVSVHLGGKEYAESYSFYPKHGYRETEPRYMKKEL